MSNELFRMVRVTYSTNTKFLNSVFLDKKWIDWREGIGGRGGKRSNHKMLTDLEVLLKSGIIKSKLRATD